MIDGLEMKKRAREYDQMFLGLGEFAYIVGMSKQALSNRIKRKPFSYPKPMQRLAMGPVWSIMQIRDWLKS